MRTGERQLSSTGEAFAQVLRPDGTVIDTTAAAGSAPLLDRASLEQAAQGSVIVERATPTALRCGWWRGP